MSRILRSAYASDAPLGSHYERKLGLTLANIYRHKLLLMATVAAGLMLGVALALIMPKRYTAEAYIRGGFGTEEAMSPDEKKDGAEGIVALDASMLVETRSRLLTSPLLAQRVVRRLGLERIRSEVSDGQLSTWLRAMFYGGATSTPGFQEDMAARKLLSGLSIQTEPRVYLIVVRYTAGDPELAALIANGFVVEFMQTLTLQILSQQRDLAERKLYAGLATLGEKHPRVVEARMRLGAADAILKGQRAKTTEEIERTAGANFAFAQANSVPSSPNPTVLIGVATLIGLAGGIATATLRGRSSLSN